MQSAPIPDHKIKAMCQRAFGEAITSQPIHLHEIPGGTFNTTYLVEPDKYPKAILRIAPQADNTHWDDAFLMRREHAIQPFFAPIASLMPKIILVDFTHQLMDRDYMFQSYVDGERWDHIQDQLTPEDEARLWGQFGEILKHIHSVQGSAFGYPSPGLQFATWSEAVLHRLERIAGDFKQRNVNGAVLASIIETTQKRRSLLDEVKRPALLHGDLWLFNILIQRRADGFNIVGILDADRAWWGDPLADWTMFIWANLPSTPEFSRATAAFWTSYGQPPETVGLAFRKQIYEAMHAAGSLRWAVDHHNTGLIDQAREKLAALQKDML